MKIYLKVKCAILGHKLKCVSEHYINHNPPMYINYECERCGKKEVFINPCFYMDKDN
jgi:hypothetical protein